MLNSDNFADHADWRLPNRNELESIVNLGNTSPAVDAAFNTGCVGSCDATTMTCSCTQPGFYWSSTPAIAFPTEAWLVGFFAGSVSLDSQTGNYYVRGVRSGP